MCPYRIPLLCVFATLRLYVFNLQWHIRELKILRLGDTFIQFIPYQYKNTVEINPYHEDDQTPDRTIKKVISRDIGNIEIEQYCSDDKQSSKQKRTWSKELKSFTTRITKMIQ